MIIIEKLMTATALKQECKDASFLAYSASHNDSTWKKIQLKTEKLELVNLDNFY